VKKEKHVVVGADKLVYRLAVALLPYGNVWAEKVYGRGERAKQIAEMLLRKGLITTNKATDIRHLEIQLTEEGRRKVEDFSNQR